MNSYRGAVEGKQIWLCT